MSILMELIQLWLTSGALIGSVWLFSKVLWMWNSIFTLAFVMSEFSEIFYCWKCQIPIWETWKPNFFVLFYFVFSGDSIVWIFLFPSHCFKFPSVSFLSRDGTRQSNAWSVFRQLLLNEEKVLLLTLDKWIPFKDVWPCPCLDITYSVNGEIPAICTVYNQWQRRANTAILTSYMSYGIWP